MTSSLALIIDDEPDICSLLSITLERMGIASHTAMNIAEAKQRLSINHYDLCLTDMRLPDGDGLDLVNYLQSEFPMLPVAVITAHGNMETAIRALKSGAFDFISKPIDLGNFRNIIQAALKINTANPEINDQLLIGRSLAIQKLKEQIAKISKSQAPVYISGPSGSGKELVARLIHQNGPRHDQPFIPVNCGAIPAELMESEFFGHLKGSFTGATQGKIGFFQAADKGILFLDEVADLPLLMQVKLLRAIQEKSIRPVGAVNEVNVDVRILCATHKSLHELVKINAFRQDLFYRLNVIEIKVPPLNARDDDVELLSTYILNKLAQTHQKAIPNMTPEALACLKDYAFPGNIRELENILERAFTLCDGQAIHASDLQLHAGPEILDTLDGDLDDYLIQVERQKIIKALEACQYNKTKAAKLLGVSFRTLRYRLRKLGLDQDEGKTGV